MRHGLLLIVLLSCRPDVVATAQEQTSPPPLEPQQTTVQARCAEPPESGCSVVAGRSDRIFLQAPVLLPDELREESAVLVDQGVIVCMGCGCSFHDSAQDATWIACADSILSPGLINTHDHIRYTEAKPLEPREVRYDHRHEWRKGLNGKPRLASRQNAHPLGDAWGEIRQLLAGTTSIFGSGGQRGFLRNLDKDNLLEGLSHNAAMYETFPLGDASGVLEDSGCERYSTAAVSDDTTFVPHVSEGINAAAHNEFVCMTDPVRGDDLLQNGALVHGIGLFADDLLEVASRGVGLVWSPRSNTDLYGMTADVPLAMRLGVPVALGTDWTATGSAHLLRELSCARSWSEQFWDAALTDRDLYQMVTSRAAQVLGFQDALGVLAVGRPADVVLWRRGGRRGYRAVTEATPKDVLLVLRGGRVMVGLPTLVAPLVMPEECETFDLCPTSSDSRMLCTPREIGTSIHALREELGAEAYPVAFCGTPTQEPSCAPQRPGQYSGQASSLDADGDGVPDIRDNCPTVFNPVRPLDRQDQPDHDNDGNGDLCDGCPFGDEACTFPNPDDTDADGIADIADNCLGLANAEQMDGDSDGKGDACDLCPDFANLGALGCPVTIARIKTGDIAPGARVMISGVSVHSIDTNGFYVATQHDGTMASAGYGGLYVYAPDVTPPAPGDRVRLNGSVADYFGLIELALESFDVTESATPLPAVEVNAADVAPGGAWAEAAEGLLVRVVDVVVTDLSPTGSPGEQVSGEFVVSGDGGGGLSVDDLLFKITPVALGDHFSSITGVLRFHWGRNKLMPRSGADAIR